MQRAPVDAACALTMDILATVLSKERKWLVAAAVLAAGLPMLVAGGLALTVAVAIATETLRSGIAGMGLSSGVWWSAGLIAIGISHWFLVRWCVRAGGWRALFLGLGGCLLVAAAAFVLSTLQGSAQPDDSMAGLGWGLLAFVLFFFVLLALAMGAVARWIDLRRAAAGRADSAIRN